ncbi:MAG: thioesterase [Nocardioides sp.]|nr:thioesterase [Nocardioides sp.]
MRWADLDQLGHVNNVVYVDYLQEARLDFMRTVAPERDTAGADGLVVVSHEITYRAPMPLRSRPVEVEVHVTDLRAASFTIVAELHHVGDDLPGGRVHYASARTRLTPYVLSEGRPRRMTAEERSALEPYVEPREAPPAAPVVPPARGEGVFHYPVQVRFSDVDVYGHVNNVKHVEYFQEARIKLFSELARGSGGAYPGVVVAQCDVEYKVPMMLRAEPYDCWSRITRLGTRSMTVEAEVTDGEGQDATVLARSRVVLVFFDTATQRSAEPDQRTRAVLEALLPA